MKPVLEPLPEARAGLSVLDDLETKPPSDEDLHLKHRLDNLRKRREYALRATVVSDSVSTGAVTHSNATLTAPTSVAARRLSAPAPPVASPPLMLSPLASSAGNQSAYSAYRTTALPDDDDVAPSSSSNAASAGSLVPLFHIDPDEISISPTPIGSGAFGVVLRGDYASVPVALKRLKPAAGSGPEFWAEAEILVRHSNHPNIVRCFGTTILRGQPHLVFELMDCALSEWLVNSPPPEPKMQCFVPFCLAIGHGLAHLAARQVIHRDVSLRNVLVRGKWPDSAVKLGDFGLSRQMDGGEYVPSSKVAPLRYSPAEVLKRRTQTDRVDVWAFGVLMWQMCIALEVGVLLEPYPEQSTLEVVQRIGDGDPTFFLATPKLMPPDLVPLFRSCLQHNPASRPSARELVTALGSLCKSKGS